jgi:hypothetical protein
MLNAVLYGRTPTHEYLTGLIPADLSRAVGAQTRDLKGVVGHREPGVRADAVKPSLQVAVAQLDNPVAAGADEMMMVAFAA